MAHFAEIDTNNIVRRVIVIANEKLGSPPTENAGIQVCRQILGPGNYIQTSYSGQFRKNFAGIGYSWDEKNGAFIAPRPKENPIQFDAKTKLPVLDENKQPVRLEGEWNLDENYKWEFKEKLSGSIKI